MNNNINSVHQIISELDKLIVGQNTAKRALAVSVYNHFIKSNHKTNNNILLTSRPGCGKTYLIKTVAEIMRINIINIDCSQLSSSGYIGDTIEDILSKELSRKNMSAEILENSIVILDDIDKLKYEHKSFKDNDNSASSMLKNFIRSNNISLNNIKLNTSKMLFVATGNFSGIEDIIKKRIADDKSINSLNDTPDAIRNIISFNDIIEYGIREDILNEFAILCNMPLLDMSQIRMIVLKIIRDYKNKFELEGKNIILEEPALNTITNHISQNQTDIRIIEFIIKKAILLITSESNIDSLKEIKITDDLIKEILKS